MKMNQPRKSLFFAQCSEETGGTYPQGNDVGDSCVAFKARTERRRCGCPLCHCHRRLPRVGTAHHHIPSPSTTTSASVLVAAATTATIASTAMVLLCFVVVTI